MKKLLSVILAVIMLLSVTFIPASAASSSRLENRLEAVVEGLFGTLIGNGDKVKVDVDDELIAAIRSGMQNVGYGSLAKSLSGYAVVRYGDVKDVDAIAEAISEKTVYEMYVTKDGATSVYIAVDLRENPELFDSEVFRAAVVKIIDKQGKALDPTAENIELLDYNRFAGELYLHMLIYQFTAPFKDIEWLPLVGELYDMAVVSEMNIDESRLPSSLFVAIGVIVLELFDRFGM